MNQNKKLKFLLHTVNLTMTGAARSILTCSSSLLEEGHEVVLFLEEEKVKYILPEDLKVYILTIFGLKLTSSYHLKNKSSATRTVFLHVLNVKNFILKFKFIRRVQIILRIIKKLIRFMFSLALHPIKKRFVQNYIVKYQPDIIISHNMYKDMEHLRYYERHKNFYLVMHNPPKIVYLKSKPYSILPYSSVLKTINCITVGKDLQRELEEIFPDRTAKSQTIYNPFNFSLIRELAEENIPDFLLKKTYIISVSSLTERKRVDRIIKALNLMHTLYKQEIHLVVLGRGKTEASLRILARELGLKDHIWFLGQDENPYRYMYNAKALVSAANSEGLSMVLVESLICRTPVISVEHTGANEVLTGKLSTYLVPLHEQSEDKIIKNLADNILRILKNAPEITDAYIRKFENKNIIKQWENLARNG